MKKILLIALVFSNLVASEYEYWENKFAGVLTCNSKTGAAISEVTITDVHQTDKPSVSKIEGTYKQALPFVVNLPFGISNNNFADNTGNFEAFIEGDTILDAKYKIAILSGKVKPQCFNSNPNKFSFFTEDDK